MALKAGYVGVKKNTIGKLATRSEMVILGAKNLLPNNGSSGTANGITWTVNADGSVIANGTKDSSASGFKILDRGKDNYSLPAGKYIFSGNPGVNCNMMLQATRGGNLVDLGSILGTTKEVIVDIESTDILQCVLFVVAGKTVNNVVFKPMIRLASDPISTYAPYAMTNRELTGSAIDQKTTINAIIAAATGAADFAAFKTAMGAITPVTRSAAAPDTKSEIEEEPETESTRSTKKTTTIKEGE